MLQELYLIRHAQPDRSSGIRYDVEPGPPLTPLGQEEARQAAYWLDDRGLEYIYSSPFLRTTATADTIVEQLALPISYVQALAEFGPGESEATVRTRVATFLSELDQSPLRSIALVSHGFCIKMLLFHTTHDTNDLKAHVYDFGNCAPTAGIWHGQRTPEGWQWQLAFRPNHAPAPSVLSTVLI